jgi:hypothetical protein
VKGDFWCASDRALMDFDLDLLDAEIALGEVFCAAVQVMARFAQGARKKAHQPITNTK